jgi:hypothetical protein
MKGGLRAFEGRRDQAPQRVLTAARGVLNFQYDRNDGL